jgi:hypothetical protein
MKHQEGSPLDLFLKRQAAGKVKPVSNDEAHKKTGKAFFILYFIVLI